MGTALEAIQQHADRRRQADEDAADRQRLTMTHRLQQEFAIFREEYGVQAAVEAIAKDCYSLAKESGKWNQQERYEIAGIIERCAEQLEAYDK